MRKSWMPFGLSLIALFWTGAKPACADNARPDNATLIMYNAATKLLQQQDFAHAAEQLKQVTETAPGFGNGHANYGLALLRLGKYDEAKVELLKATQLSPETPQAWTSLGSCLQTLGDTEGALKAFRHFLTIAPDQKTANQVKAIITGLESEQKRTSSGAPVQENADNYLNDAIQVGISRWPTSRMPIPVYIKPGVGVPGYRPEFEQILKEAFAEWQKSTGGVASFKFVDAPVNDGIACSWTEDPKKMISQAEGGHAETISDSQGILRGDITLLTAPVYNAPLLTDNYARYIDLHEIGHALGILGHSRSHEDILFSTLPLNDSNCHLSKRDYNTLIALYKLDASQVSSNPLDAQKALMSGDPNSIPIRVIRLNVEAQTAMKSANLPLAIEKLKEALKLDPDNELVQANLGASYVNAASLASAIQNWPQAERYFKLAIPLLEKSPQKEALVRTLPAYASVLRIEGRSSEAKVIDARIKSLKGN